MQELNGVHIYIFFKVFLFGLEKKWSWPFGVFTSHPSHVSRYIRNIFQAVTPITSKQRSPLCLSSFDYAEGCFRGLQLSALPCLGAPLSKKARNRARDRAILEVGAKLGL